MSSKHKPLPVSFGGITKDNVEQLRMINTSCFPVQYNDAFYREAVDRRDDELCKFAYWNGFVVGAICARIEPMPTHGETAPANANANANGSDDKTKKEGEEGSATSSTSNGKPEGRKRLYVMTLAVLAAYRGRGVGRALVKSVLDHVEENIDTPKFRDVDEVLLHVQTSNDGAMRFYVDGFGFDKGPMVENYYRRIDPPHCYVLSKKLR